jgi:hypothetical protein
LSQQSSPYSLPDCAGFFDRVPEIMLRQATLRVY